MNSKYDLDDFEKVANKEATIDEIAKKYGVSSSRVRQAMLERGFYIKKRIKIVSPYKTIIVQDKQKCAEELNVSRSTIVNALKGKRVPILEELNIRVYFIDENDDV